MSKFGIIKDLIYICTVRKALNIRVTWCSCTLTSLGMIGSYAVKSILLSARVRKKIEDSLLPAMWHILRLSQAGKHGKEDHGVQELWTTTKSCGNAVLVCMAI